jgi:hypothetical protein
MRGLRPAEAQGFRLVIEELLQPVQCRAARQRHSGIMLRRQPATFDIGDRVDYHCHPAIFPFATRPLCSTPHIRTGLPAVAFSPRESGRYARRAEQSEQVHGAYAMTDDSNARLDAALERFTGRRTAGTAEKAPDKDEATPFPEKFASLKTSVIRPVFEAIGNKLKERGHEFNVSEEAGGRISIHIVPAGVNKSIHPYDWFPTLTYFGTPVAGTIGLQGRNTRPNSEVASGSRGIYAPGQINKELVERELTKFIGEIANW